MSIKIGIMGYGNIGRGVECAIHQNPDLELAAIFTRRDPSQLHPLTPGAVVVAAADAPNWQDKIDVMLLCGGSAFDLPQHTPCYAKLFNVVDSFDTHACIPEHYAAADEAAKEGGKLALICGGWDPGMFSLLRLYSGCILPCGYDYTFWGKGVSQGHSDAIRRLPGVKNAVQYTIPVEESLQAVREGQHPTLSAGDKHTRECFVVLEEGADPQAVEDAIKSLPNYFDQYKTTVHFVSEEDLQRDHSGMPHGGFVLRNGGNGWNNEHKSVIEYSVQLESNPEFTAGILVALARAAYRLAADGQTGCRTIFDVPPAYLSALSGEELRAHLL